jgi:hypothetical protein
MNRQRPIALRTRCFIDSRNKGLEYSVVQLADGSGWRWEVTFADGKHRYGVTPVSRAVAIKQAKHEIERALMGRK